MSVLQMISLRRAIGLMGLALLLVGRSAWAQPDPPGRVGRVSDLAGEIHLSNDATQSSWAGVGLNYPLTSGDDLWISHEGRAEVDFGDGHIRLAGDSNLHLDRLDDRRIELKLATGRMILSLRHIDAGEVVEVFTANVRIGVLRPGVYRIDVNSDRSVSVLVVREGEAVLERTGESTVVRGGETATVTGFEYPSLALRSGYYSDAFDGWSEARDRRFETSASARHVSSQMIGWRDLDDHGTWHTHSTYGAIWYPRSVALGWAPYRHGRWVWVSPWGWTWLDEAPWGFAPFHYGRWVYVSGRWAWAPGRYSVRPVYAPALVTFIGGTNWSFSVNAPLFAWVPLGWHDPYRPYYHCTTNYIRTVNRPYVVNYTEIHSKPPAPVSALANARVPGAITSVPGAAFGSGQRVTEAMVQVPERALGGAPVLAGAPAVKPVAVANAASGVNVVPASRVFKPVAGGGLRETTGAPVGGAGASPSPVMPRTQPPQALRESPTQGNKPMTGGSGISETSPQAARPALPPARSEAQPSARELRPQGPPREFAPGGGVARGNGGAQLREAPSASRSGPAERQALPGASGKPLHVPEQRNAYPGGSGVSPPPRTVEERRAAPPAVSRANPQAAPMVVDKPQGGKPEARLERRGEPRGAPGSEPGRIMEGSRLK